MMRRLKRHASSAAFLIGVLSVGVPFWLMPYRTINVPDALYGPGLVVVLALAALLRAAGAASFLKALNVMAATVPTAVIARVIVEATIDPTKHNLWPLVVLIAAVLGYACAAPGTAVGHWIYRAREQRSGSARS